ncbi:enoyl-CoA hydratase/isomerase family protein [Paraburkholderia lycopersici]|uniref:2-(1,2-epoxy-1,2-dihydrophenyl)acetyl-CoA isomerase n=1 Tax=Paraburkholderia lycopersici TaxID=416944 RepID=A0A1G7B2N7_9BURK|nr:enoyl-CoA hydratase/isomerase family protein [Paraburkholderia lycopersici]SDE21384.1 2-(1,2-epoxy-1,2-dihydrophenyl)acetyl-CoA isomerase [Paraburkholderia lycopersici]
MSDDEQRTLLIEREAGIETLTFNRPEARNALNVQMREELHDAVQRIRADRSVRAVVLRGAGEDFCSGGDVRGMNVTSAQAGRDRIDDLHGWVSTLIDLDRPVIAAVDGVCYGAGFSLALAADFVIASARARFCMPFMKVGLVPDCGAFYTLPRVVGLARAKDLVFTAREVRAAQAKEMGAVLEVVEAGHLHVRAAQIAASLAAASPVAFGIAKRALNQSLGSDLRVMLEIESAAQGIAFTTGFHHEAVKRFREKADPLFTWPAADA